MKLLTSANAVIRSARFGGREQGRDRDLNEWVERKGGEMMRQRGESESVGEKHGRAATDITEQTLPVYRIGCYIIYLRERIHNLVKRCNFYSTLNERGFIEIRLF